MGTTNRTKVKGTDVMEKRIKRVINILQDGLEHPYSTQGYRMNTGGKYYGKGKQFKDEE